MAEPVLLAEEKIAALKELYAGATQKMEEALRQLLEKYGQQRDGLTYIVAVHKDIYSGHPFFDRKTRIVGVTQAGEFFSWERKGVHESLPKDIIFKYCKCSGDQAFWDLKQDIHYTHRSPLRIEVKAHNCAIAQDLEQKLDGVLPYTPSPDDEKYSAKVSLKIGSDLIKIRKAKTNPQGFFGYAANASTEQHPLSLLGYILNVVKEQERKR